MTIGFSHQETPMGLRVAQAVGITASAYLFGQNAGISYLAIPPIMMAPAPIAAKQWRKLYDAGIQVGPGIAIVSALATAYVAYHQDPASTPFKLNVAATILVPSLFPFTFAFMMPTIDKLKAKQASLATTSAEDKAAEAGVAKDETVHALIDKWATMNLARAALVGLGSIMAVWGAVSKLEIVGFSDIGFRTGANRLG